MSDDTNTEHDGSFDYARKHVLRVYMRENDRYQGECYYRCVIKTRSDNKHENA